MSLKLTLAPPGGHLQHFPCKLRLKIFFHRPRGAGAPTAPLGTPMLRQKLYTPSPHNRSQENKRVM